MLRYKEEKVLLELEMSNSRRSIEYRVAQWRQRANDTSGGKRAYALRQVAQWNTLRKHAAKGVEIIQQSLEKLVSSSQS